MAFYHESIEAAVLAQPSRIHFPRQLPLQLQGRVTQAEFEEILVTAEHPMNDALRHQPNLLWILVPFGLFYVIPKLISTQNRCLAAAAHATDAVAAESARTFEPRGIQFSFYLARVDRQEVCKIDIRVMPDTAPTAATPDGQDYLASLTHDIHDLR